jgi:16S rRNA (adenine1518-N6/adenine1519-N6)-dimethyltransferase
LAVLMALCARLEVLRRVPATAFWPRPKVESQLLQVELAADRPGFDQLQQLEDFLRLAFHNRRKTLANSIREAARGASSADVSKLFCETLEKNWRAEALDPVQLYDLARSWAGCAQGERYRPGAGRRPE